MYFLLNLVFAVELDFLLFFQVEIALSRYSFLAPLSSSNSAISNSVSVISLNSFKYSSFDFGFTIVADRIVILCLGRNAQKSE